MRIAFFMPQTGSWLVGGIALLGVFLAAMAGAYVVQQVSPAFLRLMIPWLLIGIAAYMLLQPRFGLQARPGVMSGGWFAGCFGVGIGFYDGFFGPGTGTFWAMACVLGLGFNLTRATGYTKVMNFASNLSSLGLFLLGGKVYFAAGLVMGIGQLLGARLGARMVIARGTKFIRPIFLTVVFALTIKLLLDAW